MRKNKRILIIISAFSCCLTIAFAVKHLDTRAQSAQSCPSGIVLTKPYANQVLSGVVPLEVTVSSTSYYVQNVEFFVDGNPVGNGQPDNNYWRLPMDTRAVSNGGHTIKAIVYMSSGSDTGVGSCFTNGVSVSVQNQHENQAQLEVRVLPSSWRGPSNVTTDIRAQVTLKNGTLSEDVSQHATYNWTTTIGYLPPAQGKTITFNSGPKLGQGKISVEALYGNLKATAQVLIEVTSAEDAETYPVIMDSSGQPLPEPISDTADSVLNLGQNPLTNTIANLRYGDAELHRCLSNSLGDVVYQNYIAQKLPLTFDDLALTEQCFARRRFVIPSNLAPVSPSAVKNLKVDKKLKVRQISTLDTVNGKKIVISGDAFPGANLVIYMYSEPLVLATKSNQNGQWTYTLEDPLEPGNHEIFVTVGQENAEPVRSGGFAFSVLPTAATDQNPLGLSFDVSTISDPSNYYFIYGAITVLLVILGSAFLWWKVYRKKRQSAVLPVDLDQNVQG